jgi:hypothetical protein
VSAYLVKDYLEEAEYKPIPVQLDKIKCANETEEEFLADGVALVGLRDPLLLLVSKHKDLTMDGDQPYIKEPFICMRGCEYLLAAKELGYEAIDCIIADDEVWLKAIEYALKQG